MKLRAYQVEWLGRIREASKKHRRILLRAGTGSGKTVVAVALMREATRNDQSCLFLVHRRELVEQCVDRLRERGEAEVGIILSGAKEQRAMPIQVASIQTLERRKLPPADIVIIDEAHHAASRSYRGLLAKYPKAQVYGLTATPERLDGQPLGDLFDVIVESAPEDDLVKAGFLARPRIWSHPTDDLQGVRIKGGDYDAEEVWEKADRRKLVGDVVEHWQRFAAGLQTVAYAINLRHGEMMLRCFQRAGVPSAMVHGGTPRVERERLLESIRGGGIRVLVNVAILTEGWDAPEVRCAVVCRPTTSIAFWRQMCGRVTRPGETPIILDHAGNALLHGGPLDPIPWSLESKRERTKHGNRKCASKECPECGSAVGLGRKECPNCGHEFWTTEPPEEVQAWLQEMTGPSLRERAVEMVRSGKARADVARELGVSPARVSTWAKEAGIPCARYSTALRDQVISRIKAGERQSAVASELAVSVASVQAWLREAGVELRTPRILRKKKAKFLRELNSSGNINHAARESGLSKSAAQRYAREAEFSPRRLTDDEKKEHQRRWRENRKRRYHSDADFRRRWLDQGKAYERRRLDRKKAQAAE